MKNQQKVSSLAAALLAAGIGSAAAKGQEGPAYQSLQKLAANGIADQTYDGNSRMNLTVDAAVAKSAMSSAAASPRRGVTHRAPASYREAHAAPPARVEQKSGLMRGSIWIGGGLLGAFGGVMLAGAISGGLLLPIALGIFGFMVGAAIADAIFNVAG